MRSCVLLYSVAGSVHTYYLLSVWLAVPHTTTTSSSSCVWTSLVDYVVLRARSVYFATAMNTARAQSKTCSGILRKSSCYIARMCYMCISEVGLWFCSVYIVLYIYIYSIACRSTTTTHHDYNPGLSELYAHNRRILFIYPEIRI